MVHGVERLFAGPEGMVPRPSVDDGVEQQDQVTGIQRFVVLDDPRTFRKNAFTFCLEGLVSTFPFGYLRTVWPRKSKPSSTRVMTVFSCELQPTLPHESLHERFDCGFQKLLRISRDDEVISVPRQVDHVAGAVFPPWEVFFEEGGESVQS
jgi:hypothetical protein